MFRFKRYISGKDHFKGTALVEHTKQRVMMKHMFAMFGECKVNYKVLFTLMTS